mmetsp:Transcript_16234/g.25963  ORF Transcript_16234/g.25963 Transcript_16234/m.25963 type:complete len:280 (-) Transcript_16234:539-1378(-)
MNGHRKIFRKIKRGETLRKQLSLKESANALLKRAQKATFRIYFHFIRDNAVSQVNIPADVLSELEDYFSASCFEDLRIQFYGMTHVSALSRSATADEERAAMVVAPADDDSRGRAKTFHGEAPQEFNPIGQVSPTLSQGASRGATPRNAPLDSGLRMDSELGKGTPTASEIRGTSRDDIRVASPGPDTSMRNMSSTTFQKTSQISSRRPGTPQLMFHDKKGKDFAARAKKLLSKENRDFIEALQNTRDLNRSSEGNKYLKSNQVISRTSDSDQKKLCKK